MGELIDMNWEQMKKNKGARVRVVPIACRLDDKGRELSLLDDDWLIEDVSNDGVAVRNLRSDRRTTLGKDHIVEYTSNPDRSRHRIKHGFLTLKVQIFLQGNDLWIRPTRPGEPNKPPLVAIVDKWVDQKYPFDSGILKRLEAQGYHVGWCWDTVLSRRVDLEGWELVLEPNPDGSLTKFRLKDLIVNQTLIKKR